MSAMQCMECGFSNMISAVDRSIKAVRNEIARFIPLMIKRLFDKYISE